MCFASASELGQDYHYGNKVSLYSYKYRSGYSHYKFDKIIFGTSPGARPFLKGGGEKEEKVSTRKYCKSLHADLDSSFFFLRQNLNVAWLEPRFARNKYYC